MSRLYFAISAGVEFCQREWANATTRIHLLSSDSSVSYLNMKENKPWNQHGFTHSQILVKILSVAIIISLISFDNIVLKLEALIFSTKEY